MRIVLNMENPAGQLASIALEWPQISVLEDRAFEPVDLSEPMLVTSVTVEIQRFEEEADDDAG